MGSLRNLFKNTLPSLASLWPDNSNDRDAERPDGAADDLYSRVQKRESTYEMMRECPEIIEEVVEMRYNTGTIVKPHLRGGGHGKLSAQELFEIPLDEHADAKEGGSDSGVSSKTSENGDLYAVPRRKSRNAPQPPTSLPAITGSYKKSERAGSTGVYESPMGSLGMFENPSLSGPVSDLSMTGMYENPLIATESFYANANIVEEAERSDQLAPRHINDFGGERIKKKPMPSPKPESVMIIAAENAANKPSSLRAGSLRAAPKTVAFVSPAFGEDITKHKTRSLQNLQQCFAEIEIPKPRIKAKKSFRLHPKPQSEMTPEELAASANGTPLQKSINDNFVLRPARRFVRRQPSFRPPNGDKRDILNDSIDGGEVDEADDGDDQDDDLLVTGSDDDHEEDMDNDELEIDAAIDEALEAESMAGSLRLPQRSVSADGHASLLPLEPLYANRQDVRQGLIEDLRQRQQELELAAREGTDDAISTTGSVANSDLFRAVPIEITSMDTLPKKSGRESRQRDDDDDEQVDDRKQQDQHNRSRDKTESENALDEIVPAPDQQQDGTVAVVTPPPFPPETYITLNLKDHRSPRAGAPAPPAYRKAKLRKASSMSDLLPTLFGNREPAKLPATMSLNTATRLEAAHRSLRDHAKEASRQSRPPSAASSAYLTAWLTMAAALTVLRRWAVAAGGAVGGLVGRAASPVVDWVGMKYMTVHRNHPWLPDLVSQPDLDYWVRRTKKPAGGQGAAARPEYEYRSDLEVSYAKSLQKLSSKLLKASKEGLGSVNQAWQMVGAEMEYEADVHKTMAVTFTEELVKPLKGLIDTQYKVRKSVEGMVDKTAKNLAEWRSAEAKAKKMSYQCARENEKAEELALDVRLGRGKQLSDKEINKVENRRQKTGNAMTKADTDYYTFCLRGERARLEWETAVNKGSQCFQALEEERLVRLRSAVQAYHQNMRSLGPKMMQSADRLSEPIQCADVNRDVQTVINVKGSGHNIPEQLLPDFYAEDMTNVMNRERRKKALEQFLHLIRSGVERERRGKHGVENLAKAIQETPHFGSEGSKKDVHEKLQHTRALLAYLEASRYKLQVALAELEGQPRPQHPLRKHIEYHKDRQGMTQTILKVPAWVALEPLDLSPESSPTWAADRGKADGTSHQPDSDFDEFSSQGDERDYQSAVTGGGPAPDGGASPPADSGGGSASSDQLTVSPSPVEPGLAPAVGRCKVQYDYTANMYDELTIKAGDLINIHDKQEDGWWLGELNGTVGIFPATYVLELSGS
ncbi:Nostrin [Amphibalanus amphitrite]|uniref:Nostrin n=1 Tax=Amphibalanus amphitrite TaxID=1232801 RepID=A0A6A4WEQ1_AMPAM|nr:Nostrin [Amphibalanus amphitrite]